MKNNIQNRIKKEMILASIVTLLVVVAIAGYSPAETPISVKSTPATLSADLHTSTCPQAPAPCGETSWVIGLDQYIESQAALYAYLEAARNQSNYSPSSGGGGYPRGCIGGESACIPTTPGTCVLPAYICARESSAINKYNYGGSGASGKYQAMRSTWGGYAGYENAADAPEAIQDQWASELWNNGAGCSHWSAC